MSEATSSLSTHIILNTNVYALFVRARAEMCACIIYSIRGFFLRRRARPRFSSLRAFECYRSVRLLISVRVGRWSFAVLGILSGMYCHVCRVTSMYLFL